MQSPDTKRNGTMLDYAVWTCVAQKMQRFDTERNAQSIAAQFATKIYELYSSPSGLLIYLSDQTLSSTLPERPVSCEDEAEPSAACYALQALWTQSVDEKNEIYRDFVANYISKRIALAQQRPLQLTHILRMAHTVNGV